MKGMCIRMVVYIVIFLVCLSFIISVSANLYAKGQLYEKMSNPVVYGAGKLTEVATEPTINTCNDFLLEVETLFVYDELERECSRWFLSCIENMENAPQNPWAKSELSERDLEAVNYLDPNCKTSGIVKLMKRWEGKNSDFASRNEFEQYNLIKNACGSDLVERVYSR